MQKITGGLLACRMQDGLDELGDLLALAASASAVVLGDAFGFGRWLRVLLRVRWLPVVGGSASAACLVKAFVFGCCLWRSKP